MSRERFVPLAALAAALVGTGCSGGSGGGDIAAGGDSGSLSVGLIDAPVTDVEEIWIEISHLRLKPQGDGPAIEFPFDPPVSVNLLELTPASAAWLLNGETVPAGVYNWLELELNAELDGEFDSYVVTSVGGQEEIELRVPSGSLRLVSGFTVTANQETEFLVDWDMRRALLAPPGQQPGYMLRPAFRIIDMTEYGTLRGSVATAVVVDPACAADSADLDVGNVVYVYAGHAVEPDDIFSTDTDDGTEPGPIATVAVTQDSAGVYSYSTILSPGDYTVAFTCVAGNDDPTADDWDGAAGTGVVTFLAPTDVTVAADAEVSVDF